MNFSQQSYASSSSQASTGLAYSISTLPSNYSIAPFLSQESSTSVTDKNSPEAFKQNIHIALDQVARVNALARGGLNGIQNAYQAGNSPAQTEADLIALDQSLHSLADFLKTTGVGAYPLLPSDLQGASSVPPTELHLIAEMNREVQFLYEKLKRIQESSGVVAQHLYSIYDETKTLVVSYYATQDVRSVLLSCSGVLPANPKRFIDAGSFRDGRM
ncbi:hypothetical protein EDD16DRAFT_1010273 [Pisolithus croceorrhizus]|nr:hypothetical protein EDD16DRAFT_1010273 [Pisolithus croceorrhizus]KAI6125202.1 hypothetical protein EV401DRAFT_2259487 [Pisolithus croceorrhizus]KAI6161484.1 hypothetical protein EDD17DRAFT_1698059 [Pisolithus thermaeus]